MSSKSCRNLVLALATTLAACPNAWAQGFAAAISPSRFEFEAQPGDTIRDTLVLLNPAETASEYLFRTTDWRLNDSSGVEYLEDELAEGSCRPWVSLERRTVALAAGGRKNYRFEIHIPEDAPAGLCRFAILIEPSDAGRSEANDSTVSIPIVGRFAVITYVTIGDAEAVIENLGLSVTENNGISVPAITLRNTGNTYDRTFGQIMASDAAGNRVSLVPSDFPLLPGRTETIPLIPEADASGAAPINRDNPLAYPLRLEGRLEIGAESIRIDEMLGQESISP